MRGLAAIALLLLTACPSSRPPDAAQLCAQAESLLRDERIDLALAKVDQGLSRSPFDPYWQLRFRLVKGEILIAGRRAEAALSILDPLPLPADPRLRCRLLMNRGYARARLFQYQRAESLLLDARRIAASANLSDMTGEVDLRLGALYTLEDRTEAAEEKFRSVLDSANARGDTYLAAMASGDLGVLDNLHNRAEEAIFWFERARALFEARHASQPLVRLTGNIGWCHLTLGDLDAALLAFDESARQAAAIGALSDEIHALDGSADALTEMNRLEEAAGRSLKALDIARKLNTPDTTADLLEDLATISIHRKQWDAAERYNNEASRIRVSLNRAQLPYVNLQLAAHIDAGRGAFAKAETAFRQVLADRPNDPSLVLDSRAGLADLYTSAGDLVSAGRQYREALVFIDSQRSRLQDDRHKLTYFSSLIRFTDSYVAFLVEHGRTAEALEVADSSRARLLSEKRNAAQRPHSVAEFRALARSSHSILLSYWLAPEHSYLWVVTPSDIVTVPLPAESQLRPLVEGYQAFLEDLRDPLTSDYPAGARLWDMLVQPARAWVPDGARVIIVPDGVLHSLNFATLPMPGSQPAFWIEHATLSVAPSLGLLVDSSGPHPRGDSSLLLIGDPESPGEDFPRLLHAAEEIRAVASHFPAHRAVVFQGARALPAAYRDSVPRQFDLIHFATHASPNREDPLDSSLILSPQSDGFKLRARELVSLPLRAQLVTVSACRSAGAKTYSGEGLVGLAWAFLEAGAHNVIAGLWDVDDASTPALMGVLYSGLARRLPPADALRLAQLDLIHSNSTRSKPYYWGAFQLYTGTLR